MLKWLIVLAFVGMLICMTENPADLWTRLTRSGGGSTTPGNGSPSATKSIGDEATGFIRRITGHSVWSEQNVAGLGLELPFALQSQPLSSSHPNIRKEAFYGNLSSRTIYVTHGKNTTLAGGIMLSWGESVLNFGAQRLKMAPMARNPTSTLIRGLRVQRSDYASLAGSPRRRARCALLEKGDQAWCLEFHSLEADSEAERDFLRVVNSARPL